MTFLEAPSNILQYFLNVKRLALMVINRKITTQTTVYLYNKKHILYTCYKNFE